MSESVQISKPKSKKSFYKKWWFWVIVAIIVIGGGASSKQATKVGTNNSNTSQSSEQTEFKVGDAIAFDNKQITVTSVDRNYSSGNTYITPKDGKEFVKINVTISNKSNDKVSYNTFDWEIQDSNGTIEDYSDAMMAQADDALGSGDLAKGGTKTGSIVFEVPSGDAGLILHYKPSFWSDRDIEIDL